MSRFSRARARRCVVLLVLASLTSPSTAQEVPPDLHVPQVLDTGWLDAGENGGVLAAFPVTYTGGRSLRLYFDEVALGASSRGERGSFLRLTSLEDGAEQTLGAEHVRQWHHSSAYFNGDTVLVELIAAPGSGAHRVALRGLDVGTAWFAPPSICGSDERLPSSDPRVARLMPVGCTAWLIDDCAHCFLSAGHCFTNANACQFNVPLSDPDGSVNHPSPQDQYPVDDDSIQANGVGVGNDWAYFGCHPNASTGQTAFDVQGDAFSLAPPPGGSPTVRVTGHGIDSTPNSWNQVQQTATGPLTFVNPIEVEFIVDSNPGNSGSPIIHEASGAAIGILTHSGCGAFGGGNKGTNIDHVDLQDALACPQGVCDTGKPTPFADLGGSSGIFGWDTPALKAIGDLTPGETFKLKLSVDGGFAGSLGTLIVGLTALDVPWQGGVLVPTPDIVVPGIPMPLGDPGVFALFPEWPAGVPSGTTIYLQYWIDVPLDPPFSDVTISSNGLSITAP